MISISPLKKTENDEADKFIMQKEKQISSLCNN